jgi:hypothetical protein
MVFNIGFDCGQLIHFPSAAVLQSYHVVSCLSVKVLEMIEKQVVDK